MENEIENEDQLGRLVFHLIKQAESHSEEQKAERETALKYYDCDLGDMPTDEGESAAVTNEVRSVIKDIMPSIQRNLIRGQKIVDYAPLGPETEQMAKDATEYVNNVVVKESNVKQAIYDACFDAAVVKTGILKWSAYQSKEQKHFSQEVTADMLADIEADGADITEVEPVEGVPDVYSAQWTQSVAKTDIKLEAVERGNFLIMPEAKSIEESALVGECLNITRSELVNRGYDKEIVKSIPVFSKTNETGDDEERKGDDHTGDYNHEGGKSEEVVAVYEVYVKLDLDDDGISETHKIVIAENSSEETKDAHLILEQEEVEEAPYSAVVIERTAHNFEGRSLAEDVVPYQRVNTTLLRETLNNLYATNNPQAAYDPTRLTREGAEAVINPSIGEPIELNSGARIEDAVQWRVTPFVADKSFPMMEFISDQVRQVSGVTDDSAGLAPDAFQGMTATTANILNQAGLSQSEMMVATLAEGGIEKAFEGLLKLVIAHTEGSVDSKIKGDWRSFTPSEWDSDLKAKINVGLGAGSKEKDQTALLSLYNMQKEIMLAAPENPLVGMEQLYNTLEKMVELLGLPSVEPYFKKPDPNAPPKQEGPSEAQMKLMATTQIEQMKADARTQVENAQMVADLKVQDAAQQNAIAIETLKSEKDLEINVLKIQLDTKKHDDEMAYKYAALYHKTNNSGRSEASFG